MTASTLPRWSADTEPAFVLQLAQALQPQFDITILAPHCPGARRDECLGGVRIHRYRYAPLSWQSLAYQGGMLNKLHERPLRWLLVPCLLLAQLIAMLRLHRQRRFDLLHVHWIVPQGLVAALLRRMRLLEIPALLTCHGGDLYALGKINAMKRWVLATMPAISVVSRAMVSECESLGVPRERILVRSMGVDLTARFVASRPFAQRAGLIFVGRLVEKKGVDTLLRAFRLLHERYSDERLTVVGDGPLRPTLERLTGELGCGGAVDFVGAVPNEQLPEHFNRARIAVVPSVVADDGDQEGLGLVAVEAMGCGCVVVCSDLPALRDVVRTGENGLAFTAGDENALAESLRRLFDEPGQASRLAQAGRDSVVERFGWPGVAAEYGHRYLQLLRAAG